MFKCMIALVKIGAVVENLKSNCLISRNLLTTLLLFEC